MNVDVIGASFGSSSPTRIGAEMICLPLSPPTGGPMFTLDCVVGGLIVASTIFALFGPSGPDVTPADISRRTERVHRSQPHSKL